MMSDTLYSGPLGGSLVGAPKSVPGNFICAKSNLLSLDGCPELIGGDFDCSFNQLADLKDIQKQIKKMNGIFYAHDNPISSHVLGLLLIEGCTGIRVDNRAVERIVNRHLPTRPGTLDLYECQIELIEAYLENYANL